MSALQRLEDLDDERLDGLAYRVARFLVAVMGYVDELIAARDPERAELWELRRRKQLARERRTVRALERCECSPWDAA